MTSGKKRRNIPKVTGLHIVRKILPGGDRYYVYAWRGGPRIHIEDGRYPTVTRQLLLKQQSAFDKTRKPVSSIDLNALITEYKASPDYVDLKPSTKKDYRLWLDRISDKFGTIPLEVMDSRKIRHDILLWRDQMADNPRKADKAVGTLSTVLSWGVNRARLNINAAAKIKNLHKVNRSEKIWEANHWEAFLKEKPSKQLLEALTLASLTGIRLGDLVKITWADVFPNAIKIQTSKRNGRAVIPIIPELRTWLSDRNQEGTLLKNSRGYPWTSSGLGCVFQKTKPTGFDRTIHDLRGTYATRLILAGFTDEQAAMVLGWTAKRIASIRARYVDEERIIINLAEKLSASSHKS